MSGRHPPYGGTPPRKTATHMLQACNRASSDTDRRDHGIVILSRSHGDAVVSQIVV